MVLALLFSLKKKQKKNFFCQRALLRNATYSLVYSFIYYFICPLLLRQSFLMVLSNLDIPVYQVRVVIVISVSDHNQVIEVIHYTYVQRSKL